MRTPRCPGDREAGVVLAGLVIAIMIIGGLATVLLLRSASSQRATLAGMDSSRLLFVAEAGLHYNFVRMEEDALYAVKDTAGFQWDSAQQLFRSSLLHLGVTSSLGRQSFRLEVQYLSAGAPVTFASRTAPVEDFDEVKATCQAATPRCERVVAAWYHYGLDESFQGAVVSDMAPLAGAPGSGLAAAQKGHIVLDGQGRTDQHAIFGDLIANGTLVNGAGTALTGANIASAVLAHGGVITTGLQGTADEVPDYTAPGVASQAFDFDRYEAAALAGGGQVFASIAAFATAMNAANLAGEKLEGITVLHVDPVAEGPSPAIGPADIPGGIHVTGTLVLRFAAGTSPGYRVTVGTPLFVNAAPLAGLDPSNASTYPSGYPGTYADPLKKPSAVAIAPAYPDFKASDDLPAVMLENGVLALLREVDVCGLVYAPGLIEIENTEAVVQYVDGAIWAGGGVNLQGNSAAGGVQAIRYDANAVDNLETSDGKAKVMTRTQLAIVR